MNQLTAEGYARQVFEDYSDRTRYGHEDHDTALFNSIEWALRNSYSEEFRSDLYARVITAIPTANELLLVTIEKELKNG